LLTRPNTLAAYAIASARSASKKKLQNLNSGKECIINPNFHAHILQLVKPIKEEAAKTKQFELRVSVLKESGLS
jgi:hypothetical protein